MLGRDWLHQGPKPRTQFEGLLKTGSKGDCPSGFQRRHAQGCWARYPEGVLRTSPLAFPARSEAAGEP